MCFAPVFNTKVLLLEELNVFGPGICGDFLLESLQSQDESMALYTNVMSKYDTNTQSHIQGYEI